MELSSILGQSENQTTQAQLRGLYHERLLGDLDAFAQGLETALERDLASVRAQLAALRGKRLSPALAYAHVGLAELADLPQPIEADQLTGALEKLETALEQPTREKFTVGTLTGAEAWERAFVGFCLAEGRAVAGHYPDPEQLATAEALPKDALERYQRTIASVLDALRRFAPSAARDIEEFISDLRVFRGRRLRGASAPSYFGAVLIREPDTADGHRDGAPGASTDDEAWLWFADHLTHEAAHHRLYLACADDPLVTENVLVTSPVRNDPRPLSGVVHALWVETRLVTTFRNLYANRHALPLAEHDALRARLDEFEHTHHSCHATVAASRAHLTMTGLSILEQCTLTSHA